MAVETMAVFASLASVSFRLQLRRMISTTSSICFNDIKNAPEVLGDQNHRHARYILQSGLRYLKERDIDELKANIINRGLSINIDELVSQVDQYRKMSYNLKKLAEARNIATKQIHKASSAQRDTLIAEARDIKNSITELETKHLELERTLYEMILQLPNYTHPSVPIGDENNANIVRVHGSKPEFNFHVSDHLQIGENTGTINMKSAANTSGRNFYFLEGPGADLELALTQYAMKKAKSKGFKPVITPDIVTYDLIKGCGFLPRDHASSHLYELHPERHPYKCLAGTAEIPLAGLYMDRVIPLQDLPIKVVAFGRCFRAEAGGFGIHNRGLYRVHQFTKVELFALTANETGGESESLLNEIIEIQQEINSELGFHFKVLEMPTSELGVPAYHKFDIEVWMPGLGLYGEVSSASNCTDFQARRLKINYRDRKTFVHTVNGTACAVPRTIVSILENYQNKDGSVTIPKVLRPYIGQDVIHPLS